jgi:hypothetical protein
MRSKKPSQTQRVELLFDTNAPVPSGCYAQITERSRRGFRIGHLCIVDHPEEWTVVGLRISERFVWEGRKRGRDFASASDPPFVDEIVKREQDVSLTVHYVGRLKKGRLFHGTILGVAA